MDTTSEYTFPIFISSTDYNLKDFRAELARFLTELGYRPILSSAEGFPDSSPNLEPWESCLPVLEASFVMILVIDGKYGYPLKWPNCKPLFEGKEVSPTHGEYILAHNKAIRMLVFIRKEVMTFYQAYRKVMRENNDDKKKTQEILEPTLPDHIDFKTLEFVHEVKITKPIPWINEFEDITLVKREIQKKMLNQLAEIFLIKDANAKLIKTAFGKLVGRLNIDERKKFLREIPETKELADAMEKVEELKENLKSAELKLVEEQNSKGANQAQYETEINALNVKINALELSTTKWANIPTYASYLKVGSPLFYPNNEGLGSKYLFPTGLNASWNSVAYSKCDGCGSVENIGNALLIYGGLRTCPTCHKSLCQKCWPISSEDSGSDVCRDCKN